MIKILIAIVIFGIIIPDDVVFARDHKQHTHKKRKLRHHEATQSQNLKLLPLQQFPSHNSYVSITTKDNKRIINSNGIPNHRIGQFPNRGNPHEIKAQNYQFTMPSTPVKNANMTVKKGWFWGVAVNGVPFEVSTGEFWQGKKNAYDGRDGWNYDALGGAIHLGLDAQHAHIQKGGAYHYHALPNALKKTSSALIGWAADGFPIYALKADFGKGKGIENAISSYRLKKGKRHNIAGRYDGAFVQDYEYVAGQGNLDECNGAFILSKEFPTGSYAYFITANFPYIPRCWYGTPDKSFSKKQ